MGRYKRMGISGVFAFFAAIMLALAFAPGVAQADDTGTYATIDTNTLNINNVIAGDKVSIYQIVRTSFNSDNNDVKQEFTVTDEHFPVSMDEWKAASGNDADHKKAAVELANKIALYWNSNKDKFVEKQEATVPEDGTSATFSNVKSGQYLVIVTPAEHSAARVFQDNIVSVMPKPNTDNWFDDVTVDATLKCTLLPESGITQKINNELNVDNIDAATPATFTIGSVVPRYTGKFDTRLYTIDGQVSAGFKFDKTSVKVKVDDADLAAEDYAIVTTEDGSGFTFTLNAAGLQAYADAQLTITYNATPRAYPDGQAPKYNTAETGKATLKFSTNSFDNDPAQSLKALNEKKTVEANVVHATFYGVKFVKQSEDATPKPLKGADFTVKHGTTIVGFGTSAADGNVEIDGALAAGIEYTFEETKAPAGYKPVTFTATITSAVEDDFSSKLVTLDAVKDPANDYAGELPVTGGPGTIALTAAGVCLIAGAAVVIGRSRKKHE